MSTNTATTVTDQVALGGAYLDEVAPGWYNGIDLDRLDIGHLENCVCGQTFGTYTRTPKLLEFAQRLKEPSIWSPSWIVVWRKRADWTVDHGFDVDPMVYGVAYLTAAWKTEIERRRAADQDLAVVHRLRPAAPAPGAYSLLAA